MSKSSSDFSMASSNGTQSMWKQRRREILIKLKDKLPPIGHVYELPKFDEDSDSPLQDLDPQKQSEFIYNLIKNVCLDQHCKHLYPFEDRTKKICFKMAKGAHSEVKNNVKRLTKTMRNIVLSRQFISHVLCKRTDLGLVTRSVADTLRDFMQNDFPEIIEKCFPGENGSLHKVDVDSTNLETDLNILCGIVKLINKQDLIGGQLISLLDSPDYHHPTLPNRSFIPSLFQRCVQAGMQHYNAFLEEFLYSGTLAIDRQHEFMIWDLNKSNMFKAQDFYPKISFSSDVPFDDRFVLIPDLIPSVWNTPDLKKMVLTLHRTRKLVHILVSETRKPFILPHVSLIELSPEKQFEVIKEANEIAGRALIEKINSEFNIQEFYNLIYEMIFNPSSTWLANFVEEVAALCNSVELLDSDADEFNRRFMFYFQPHCKKVKDDFDLVKIKLYTNTLFGKCLPLDTRFVDFVLLENDGETDDTEGDNDENHAPNKNVIKAPSNVDDPQPNGENSNQDISILDRVGIQFQNKILFKCLISPSVQEHLNRLFRLRFSLVRTNILLLERRNSADSHNESNSEQIFLSFVHNFINRYTSYVFGNLTDQQWKIFKESTPKFHSIDAVTESQRYLLRNINACAGLYVTSHKFADHLSNILNLVNNYCVGELTFNEAADEFFDNYKAMRAIACLKDNQYLNEMSYEVFRIPPLVRLSQLEKYEIDPRKGLVALPNIVVAPLNMRRSASLMNVQRR